MICIPVRHGRAEAQHGMPAFLHGNRLVFIADAALTLP